MWTVKVFRRLTRKVHRRLLGGKPHSYPLKIEQTVAGNTVVFEANSRVEEYRVAEYGGEQEFLHSFIDALTPEDVIFDIGASVGLMTVHAAKKAHKIISFEPDPDTYKCLRHNVELNNLTNVDYVTWAVSDEEDEVTLFSDGAKGFAPTLRKQEGRAGSPEGVVSVQTRTLDQAIESGELPLPTILKIDIEGAEILCLKGASRLLAGELGTKPRLIFLELHPLFLPGFDATPDQVLDLIRDGYRVRWESGREDQIHYCYERL